MFPTFLLQSQGSLTSNFRLNSFFWLLKIIFVFLRILSVQILNICSIEFPKRFPILCTQNLDLNLTNQNWNT
eukprot:snap_masked-scaffold_44-processed-gene-1.78-mRNA-1 protein AED:1.00 eAED:1.00 QI:0/0/0/0/1/1/2/0/71